MTKTLVLTLTLFCVGCVDSAGAPARPARPGSRLAASPSRDFTCDPTQVVGETTLRPVIGADGETLALVPIGDPCRYHLLYRDSGGGKKDLFGQPAFYAITHAQQFGGTTVVCASPVRHGKSQTESVRSDRFNRTVEGVRLLCTVRSGGQWTDSRVFADGGDDYAAWIVDVTSDAPGSFAAVWVRDSTFQFFNFSDAGRPDSDGVFQTAFTVDANGKMTIGATTRTSTAVAAVSVTGN
jgi:hypothetical protein